MNAQVLQALEDEPLPLSVVREVVESPPTTMRGHLRNLTELGVLEQVRREDLPAQLDLTLGPAGRGLLPVAGALRLWLSTAPDGEVELGTRAAKRTIKALIEGWSHCIVRAVAARPFSLTQLDGLISSLTYPALERRLTAMRDAGLLVACPSEGRGTPYAATDWLRRAIGPLAAAALWERSHIAEASTPVSRLDVESAFLLAVPLLTLPSELSGTCRLAVEMPRGGEHDFAGVRIEVRDGEVLSCTSRLAGPVDASLTGSTRAWLGAVIEGEPRHLERRGGDRELAAIFIDGLHGALFRVPQLP
jgi:DNA-binding HxlR family transcriptional regulator